MVDLLCFVLLFSHQHFFITIIVSLLYILAFYAVSNPQDYRDVCNQDVEMRCETISRGRLTDHEALGSSQ